VCKECPSKSAAKRAIAKKTYTITKEVNKYRLTRGLPLYVEDILLMKKDLYF
jgi:hypothetical protein